MKVKCPNCGKNVPFSGNVCPWCKADKSAAKTVKASTLVIALIFALAAGFMFNGLIAAFIGGFVGAIVGTIVGTILNSRKESHERNAGNPARRKR